MLLKPFMDTSAWPSVMVQTRNRNETFTPVIVRRQQITRSGFPSGVFGKKQKISAFYGCVAIARSTKSGFVTYWGGLEQVAVVNSCSRLRAGCNPRSTQTRRVCSKFPNSRGNCPEPSRATFRGQLERAGCFSEVTSL